MSAAAIDPATVKLANQDARTPRMVADASDDEIEQHLRDEIEYVRQVAERFEFAIDADGVPVEIDDYEDLGESRRIAARKLNESRRRILALHLEQDRRAEAQQRRDAGNLADARALLESTLAQGTAKLEALAELGDEATAAFGRVSRLVRDLELLAVCPRISSGHEALRRAMATAAKALGQDAPVIPSLPTVPDPAESARLVRVVTGPAVELLRESGLLPDLMGTSRGPDGSRVDQAAALLDEAGKGW